MARVVVAAIQKRKIPLFEQSHRYYHDPSDKHKNMVSPTPTFKFLNRAAFITVGDIKSDGSIENTWRPCTIQQVGDLKSLIKLAPLWGSGLFLSTPLIIQSSLLVLQAQKMDRQVGHHFKISAAKCSQFSLTPLRRIGIGHVLTILGMAISALVESRRLRLMRSHHLQGQNGAIVPMSVLWLVPQLAFNGIGEGFHIPGHLRFYYQEFPASLKSTSTAVVAMFIGIGFYMGNTLIDLVQRTTRWLPDNINDGRMDNIFWLCCFLGSANFMYYLVFATFYKYRNIGDKPNDAPSK
ncbi:protein NRT1/ PTR FAMILY 2.4-like [Nicotiana tabacum]|uniref:Protein NRT1/ PTR FAMILY 2.4-like n=1 Tax=Nicotiana tabacum TaxID=4097 RepID=A0AC58RSB0_TOBAC